MFINKIKEPVSCLTHLGGAIAAVFCTIALIYKAFPMGAQHVVSFAIFGIAMVLLYTASAVYHMLKVPKRISRILQRIDHTMIFSLIAGTYTPTCLITLRGAWGWAILSVVWGMAAAGMLMKLFWLTAPRLLSTIVYLIMGWTGIVAVVPLFRALSAFAFALLLLGGLCYTLGAVVYASKWPKLFPRHFGFHELFHIFVLLGSTFHVLFMFELCAA